MPPDPLALPTLPRRKTHRRIIAKHKYKAIIEECLINGWSTRNLNKYLARLYPDYVPVADQTLLDYRNKHLRGRMAPLHEYESVLKTEGTLLDTLRERALMILVQKRRLQRCLDLEIAAPVTQTQFELLTLARLLSSYDEAMREYGYVPALPTSGPTPTPTVNINVFELVQAQVQSLPVGVRETLMKMVAHVRKEVLASEVQHAEEATRAAVPHAEVNAEVHNALPSSTNGTHE